MDNTFVMSHNELEQIKKQTSEQAKQEVLNEIKTKNTFDTYTKVNESGLKNDTLAYKTISAIYSAKAQGKTLENVLEKEFKNDPAIDILRRDLQAGVLADGGAMIPAQYSRDVIPYLYNASVFLNAMPRQTMLSDTLKLPKETAAPTVFWGEEIDETSKASSSTFTDVNLSVKNAVAQTVISNTLLKAGLNNGINVENQVITSIMKAMATAVEYQILYGNGADNKPLGIDGRMAAGNKFNSAGTTLANVDADYYKALDKIESANIEVSNPQILMSSRSKNYVSSLLNSVGIKAYPDMLQKQWYGVPVGVTNNIPNTTGNGSQSHIWFIDWSKFILGVFQDMEIYVTPFGNYVDSNGAVKSGMNSDVTVVTTRMKFDFGMFYDKAAAKIEAVSYSL